MWDRQGRQFEHHGDLASAEAERLLGDNDVEVAICESTGPLQWIEPADRRRVWRDKIQPRLHDNPTWRAPREAPGTLPFVPQLWREVGGIATVVVFNDHD